MKALSCKPLQRQPLRNNVQTCDYGIVRQMSLPQTVTGRLHTLGLPLDLLPSQLSSLPPCVGHEHIQNHDNALPYEPY